MSEQARKSQAEKAADSKRSTSKKPTSKKNDSKKVRVTGPVAPEKKTEIPVRLISSVTCLALFVLFLIIAFVPGGVFVDLFNSLLCGLIGKTAFTVAIPVLLYLFFIHAFSGKRPIKMRTYCLIGFVAACGCIAHLALDTNELPSGFSLLSELYLGGISGTTSGLICGGLAMLFRMLFGVVLSYIILIIGALLMLLGGMQITIPSIIRAIKDRPRPDWEEEAEHDERQEPATVVVNHIANKRIEYLERRRQMEEAEEEDIIVTKYSDAPPKSGTKKAKEILRQIDSDVEEPVAASGIGVSDSADAEIIPVMTKPAATAATAAPAPTTGMPPLVTEEPSP